ncbi:MAG: YeeE/YedE thiosulfate transporter family protein [Magnetovibrio sp.]|nr:YeeE/YedE thiosulfate transporter family protein [Magnetovibrio sp.]
MTGFTPLSALTGGALIGAAVVLMFLFAGRVTGISGIFGGLIARPGPETAWRAMFVAGLIGGVWLYRAAGGPLDDITITGSAPLLIAGGLLVGFGARLGSGCTSGHAVCGMARFSGRSTAATVVFMATAAATVFAVRHLGGG